MTNDKLDIKIHKLDKEIKDLRKKLKLKEDKRMELLKQRWTGRYWLNDKD